MAAICLMLAPGSVSLGQIPWVLVYQGKIFKIPGMRCSTALFVYHSLWNESPDSIWLIQQKVTKGHPHRARNRFRRGHNLMEMMYPWTWQICRLWNHLRSTTCLTVILAMWFQIVFRTAWARRHPSKVVMVWQLPLGARSRVMPPVLVLHRSSLPVHTLPLAKNKPLVSLKWQLPVCHLLRLMYLWSLLVQCDPRWWRHVSLTSMRTRLNHHPGQL